MYNITFTENKYFWINPNFRLDFYLMILMGFVLIISGAVFKENLLIIIGIISLISQSKTFYLLYKSYKAKPYTITFEIDDKALNITFDDITKRIDLPYLDKLLIVFDPQSKNKNKYLFRIFCKCHNKESLLFDNIPASIFSEQNIENLKKFLRKTKKKIDLIAITSEDLY